MPMHLGKLVVCAAFALSTSTSAATQSQAPTPASPTTSTSAILIGQVVDADTGDPIEDAAVTLSGRPCPLVAAAPRRLPAATCSIS